MPPSWQVPKVAIVTTLMLYRERKICLYCMLVCMLIYNIMSMLKDDSCTVLFKRKRCECHSQCRTQDHLFRRTAH